MSMPAIRFGRIVTRAVTVLAGCVLLPVGCVGNMVLLAFCTNAGWLPVTPPLRAYAKPWHWCC